MTKFNVQVTQEAGKVRNLVADALAAAMVVLAGVLTLAQFANV